MNRKDPVHTLNLEYGEELMKHLSREEAQIGPVERTALTHFTEVPSSSWITIVPDKYDYGKIWVSIGTDHSGSYSCMKAEDHRVQEGRVLERLA